LNFVLAISKHNFQNLAAAVWTDA